MNKEILDKVDEIIKCIENTENYKKYLMLKEKLQSNKEIMLLINEIKLLQKDVVHHLDKKDELKKKLNKLEDYPLYREYNNTLLELNNTYTIMENRINKYFIDKLN